MYVTDTHSFLWFLTGDNKLGDRSLEIIESLEGNYNYVVHPLDTEVVLKCEATTLAEPHDRIIVATAKLLNAKVITKDDKIRTSKLVETVW